MRRLSRSVIAAAAATALLLASACSGSDDGGKSGSLEKVTYLTSFGNFGRDAYAYVAKEKGFFEEAGFDVEILPGQGTNDVINKILADKAQFGPIDMTGGLLQMGNGAAKDFVAVAAIQQRTMAAIVTLEDANISTPKDLEGKTIADTPASVVRNLFPTYAQMADVDASKVTWVDGEAQALMGMVASGTVDAIGQFVVGKPTLESIAKGKKAVFLPYSDVMTDLYGNVLITSKKLASDNPEKVKKFTEALLKGLEYAIENPQETGEILQKYVPEANPQAAAAELELMAAFVRSEGTGAQIGVIETERVARSIAILQGAGAIPDGLTPEQIVDVNVAPRS